MVWRFADRFRTVVTTHAVAHDVYVIKVRRQPARGAMTIVTGVAAGDVALVLADGNDAVVARTTAAKYLRVIDGHHGCEYVGSVAIFADIGCLDVCRALAGSIGAVVAAHTVTGDINVIEIRR